MARMRTGYTIRVSLIIVAAVFWTVTTTRAQTLTPLSVAYAGSMGALMDGGIKPAITRALGADLRGRAQGSTGLANLIVAGSIRPDVFIAVTPAPMRIVLRAGKARVALPIARTEMVIAYSRRGRYAAALSQANRTGAKPWWQILETPSFRFGRTDPLTDPQGLNTIFMMRLAEGYYHQPGLAVKILGAPINRQQIFEEPQVMARVQAEQIDASAAYKTQPAALGLAYVSLPAAINLGDAAMENSYRRVKLNLNGKTFRPLPLVFYAAVINGAPHPKLAAHFVQWLQGSAAKRIFARYHYDQPGQARPLSQ
ncbi:MAG: extracellular solute-binding protein [Candidatus Binataceae bacterium]